MLKFDDYKYERPDMEAFEKHFYQLLQKFDSAETPEAQNQAFRAINQMRNEFKGMKSLAFIRHSQNVADEFYQQENQFMGEAKVKYQELVTKLYKALVESRFREDLETKWGSHIFDLAENFLNIYSPEVAEYMEKENELSDKYYGLIATTKIPFQGEERNFVQLMSFIQDKDSVVRKGAQDALASVFAQNATQTGSIV